MITQIYAKLHPDFCGMENYNCILWKDSNGIYYDDSGEEIPEGAIESFKLM